MSDAETSTAPRRSQRERKQATQFISIDSSQLSQKRKRSSVDSDSEREEEGSQGSEGEDADAEGDYTAPKSSQPKKKAAEKAPAAATPTDAKPAPKKRGRPPGAGKPRVPKAAMGAGPKQRRARPRKGAAEFDPEQVAKETNIMNDNPLFNAIMNPSAALQSAAEDFLESMSHTPDAAQAELINCILRTCGCNHTYTPEEVLDYDGVVSALDDLTEQLKQEDEHVYPLTSKLPAFKPFRSSIAELITRLITSAAELGHLYSTDLIPTLTTWVNPMSSSHMRSFRHTATVIALDVATALSQVAAAVEKEAEVVSRQKEGERKRKKGKSEPATAREKELESKAREIRTRREKLAEFIKEFVYGVFVHRYRDLDPNIRAECVHAMGLWFSKHPGHFIDGEYLRYVGWVLSDANTHVRLEAVRALASAYAQSEYIGVSALQHFTERFKPRLVEMAISDTELSVRVAVVQVLQAIDEHGLLEDEQREKLCLLIFDEENKMRKAVSRFVKGVWFESVEERLVGRKPNATDKKRAGVKAFAMLLVSWGRALDEGKGLRDDEDEEDGDQSEGSSKQARRKEVAVLVGAEQKSRTALAVEALWDDVEPVSDWETLLDILLLDHSAESQANGKSRKGKGVATDSGIDEVWRLEEVEEGVLLEVLLASLRKTLAEAAAAKKGEGEAVSSDITRALIKGLPRLFVKYQTDPGRMSDVLLLPQMLNLDMYLEMRMMTAYSSLWDDVIKQFLSHSAPIVLTNAVTTIRYMMNATSLSNTNSTKILELEEELSTALRDTLKGRDELELASFSEDEVIALTAICSRLATLAGARDMTAWMEEDEGGKQSSAWDIVNALAERGRLGYKEEESMVEQALSLLTLYIIWKARGLTTSAEPSPEESRLRERLKECRDVLLEKLLEFAIGTQSNTSDGVKRAAFQNLMNLHILFAPVQATDDVSVPPTAVMPLTLDEEVQYRCAGFVQAEIERYAEDIEELSPPPSEESDDDADKSGEEEPTANKRGKGKKGSPNGVAPPETRSSLEREYIFMGVTTTFLRAIRAGTIHFQHSTTLLAHYGRLGPSFDLCAKVILDILREEGLYKNNGAEVVTVISRALREAFQLYIDGIVRTEEHAVALAKLLAGAFSIRGAQLAIVRRIEAQHVINLHTSSVSWIWKRIAQQEAGNKKARNKSIVFFKLLTPLLTAIDPRDSLAIKAHLDQVVAQSKIEIPATSKAWDPYRAYEKKLTTSKEKGGKTGKAAKKGGAKTSEMVTTDEDEAEAEEVEGLMGTPEPAPAPRAKPKPKPRARRRQASVAASDAEDDQEAAEQPVTPKAKPRARPVRKAAAKATPQQASSRSPSPMASPQMPSPGTPKSASLSEPPTTPEPHQPEEELDDDQEATPTARRKRARSDDEEEPEEAEASEEDAGPSASQETHTGAMQVKRKRVRH